MKLLIQAKNQNIQINEVNGAQLWNKVLKQGVVYSRMSPKQKAMLIEELQLMYKTMICMWGDGANDCTALKTADVGLSLSNTEASIAAPFTSSVSNISSVWTLLKQGRASLDLSYTLFRFIIVFSCIQFTSMIIWHYSLTNMDDIEFAYINICIVSPILLIYWFEDSNQSLEPKIPFKTILNKSMILSIIGHVTINVIAQAFFYLYSQDREFFIHNEKDSHLRKDTYESTIIFLFSAPQYIVIGILFNLFTPFRTRFYQNVLFMTVVVIQLLASYTMIISDWEDLRDFLNYKDIKTSYKFVLAGWTVANAFCNLIFELFIVYIFKDWKELEVREDHLKSE